MLWYLDKHIVLSYIEVIAKLRFTVYIWIRNNTIHTKSYFTFISRRKECFKFPNCNKLFNTPVSFPNDTIKLIQRKQFNVFVYFWYIFRLNFTHFILMYEILYIFVHVISNMLLICYSRIEILKQFVTEIQIFILLQYLH